MDVKKAHFCALIVCAGGAVIVRFVAHQTCAAAWLQTMGTRFLRLEKRCEAVCAPHRIDDNALQAYNLADSFDPRSDFELRALLAEGFFLSYLWVDK